jgi:hypothetical protein
MEDRLKYDKTMAKAMRSIPKPLKFTVDIVEHKEYTEVVILFARKNGFDSVRDYIKKRRYYGDEIKASDVIV